jgi:hypothetical protein
MQMTTPNETGVRDELAALRDALAAQEAARAGQGRELAALRGEVAALRAARAARRSRRGGLRGRLAAALSVALLVALVPLGLFAANPFTDLDPGQAAGHNPNIDLIYNAGITTGCSPTEYCPKEAVTREQMASFLARTAGLGNNPPVVNAKTAQNADKLDNRNANEFLRVARASSPSYVELPLQPGFETIVSTTISVPGPGYVLVTGITTVIGDGVARVLLRDTTGLLSDQKAAELDDSVNSTTLPIQHVFTVTGAGSKTFQLLGQRQVGMALAAGGEPGSGNAATTTALYIPFGASGGTP